MKHLNNRKPLGFFAMLAALLGITSGCKGGGDDIVCMYGVPTVSYELKGKVTDEAGKPVKGIRVIYNPYADKDINEVKYYLDTLYTDASGKFSSDRLKYSWPEIPAHELIVSDVDGATNGEYKDEKVPATRIKSSHSKQGSNGWYQGTFTLSSDVVVKKK